MKIANIGWSGNQNYGDDRMAYCIQRYFQNDEVIFFNGWLDAITNIKSLNSCDYLLIGGGGLIFRGFNRYIPFLQSIKIPFGCVGISIEADKLHVDMYEGLEILKKRSTFIYVRDKRSRNLLNHHYKVIMGPDITFLYPFDQPDRIKKGVALNLRNWPWWDCELYSKKDEIFRKIDRKFPYFQFFYPFKKWNPDNFIHQLNKDSKRIVPLPLYFGTYDISDHAYLGKYFLNVSKGNQINTLKRCHILIGMRLHSIIFATQLGLPFVSLSYEPKNESYCEDLGHPELSVKLKNWGEVFDRVKYVENHYVEIHKDLITYTHNSNIQAKQILKKIKMLMNK